ncbi:50S ribosomal protein L30 [Rhodothermus marinus]|uniref:50S ribosomal protein L30 n=1 Tax=Rhodothermus marinus TaxID=29549 RepID=UPI0006D048C2|nr:50S ribosomal protein L30 [Rhodothermus marinus]
MKITQVRSVIDYPERQRRTLEALGLRRIGRTVVHDDTPQIRGMLKKVEHLVRVEEIEA